MGKKKYDDEIRKNGCQFREKEFLENEDHFEKKNIADETVDYCIINGINRNIARHIPSGYDGLKPVVRRILLILSEDKSRTYRKVSSVSGDTMNKYHPHADTGISDVIGKMGQYWTNNVLYIDPDGNFGNMQGDLPAAGRYIKCRLSKFAYKCFFEDYKYASVDMKRRYTGIGFEPEYLPAKYPVALVNPQFSSIGYGTSANIAPFNFTEVLEATIKLLKNPRSQISLIPDFPNGCDVIADKNLDAINKNHGAGKVTVRSTIEIDHEDNIINIRSLPLLVGSKQVISAIAKLVVDKKIDGIKDINEYTSPKLGVWIQIHLRPEINPDKMVEDLIHRNIGLQKSFAVQIKFVEDYKEYEFSPKEYLLNWIDFRREVVQSMHNRKYVEMKQEDHMLDIKLFVFSKDNVDKTVKIIKKSSNTEESIAKLMDAYKNINMTSLQAKTICGMRFSEFNKESYKGFVARKEELKEEIEKSEKILADPSLIDNIIIDELKEGIKMFGSPRRSKIIYAEDKTKRVPDDMMIIAVSKDGMVKKLDAKKYSTIGQLGSTSSQSVVVEKIRNNKHIIVFDENGRVSKVPIAGIPVMTPDDPGLEALRYFKVTGSIIAFLPELDKDAMPDKITCIFTSKNGLQKRTRVSEFTNMKDSKVAMTLEADDKLVSIDLVHEKDEEHTIIIFTNNGDGVRIPIKDINLSGASSKGKRMIKLKPDEFVVGTNRIKPENRLLFYITSSGRGKVTEIKYFPTMSRKDDPVPLLPLSTTDKLVAVVSVKKSNTIRIYRKIGEPVDVKISDIKPSMRVAKPEKLIKVPKGDIVCSISIL